MEGVVNNKKRNTSNQTRSTNELVEEKMASQGQSKEEENQSLVKAKDEAPSQSASQSQSQRSENSLKGGGIVGEFHILHELVLLLHIALPSVCVQFNMYFLYPQGASAVGLNLGTDALAGFSLGSLVGNLTCQSIMIGALSAADTLMPRAFASQRYAELGRLALRAVAVSSVLLLPPVVILYTSTDWILVKLGQDEVAAAFAASWIRVYLLGLPANLVFRISQRFLISQHRPWPPVYASIVPSFVLQPILLRVLLPIMGFEGSALAIVISQWAMLLCLFFYLHCRPEHHPQSWPGMSWSFVKAAFLPQQFCRFFSLSLGGVVSLVSPGDLGFEYWYGWLVVFSLFCTKISWIFQSEWWFWYVTELSSNVQEATSVFTQRNNLQILS